MSKATKTFSAAVRERAVRQKALVRANRELRQANDIRRPGWPQVSAERCDS